MTSNGARADVVIRALRAGLGGETRILRELCTPDVVAWTPRWSAASRDELVAELERRDPAFSEFDLEVFPLDVGGVAACVEWVVSMSHTAPLHLGAGAVLDPTGLRVTAYGVTVAEFHGQQICGLRQYWDEGAVLAQLGLGGPEDGGPGA